MSAFSRLKRALKKSVRKQDWFFAFCVLKNVSQENLFVYKWKCTITAIGKRQRARFYIYKKAKTCDSFLYTKSRHFAKSKKFPVTFYIQKVRHFTLRNFHENVEVGIYIQKARHFAVCDVFIYKKPDTSQKVRQFALRFYIQKS